MVCAVFFHVYISCRSVSCSPPPLGVPRCRHNVLQRCKCSTDGQALEVRPGIIVRTPSELSEINAFHNLSCEVYFEDSCNSHNRSGVKENAGTKHYKPSRSFGPGRSTSIRRGSRRRIASSRSNGRFVAPMTTIPLFLLATALLRPSISCMNCVNVDR